MGIKHRTERADVPDTAHAFASHSDRFPRDQLLRCYGWHVVDRPKRGPARWKSIKGALVTFDVAVRAVLRFCGYQPEVDKASGIEVWRTRAGQALTLMEAVEAELRRDNQLVLLTGSEAA